MRTKLQKKSVTFAGQSYVLYSLDGNTWSTNPEELTLIIERHQVQRENVKDSLTGANNKRDKQAPEAEVVAKSASKIEDKAKPSEKIAAKVKVATKPKSAQRNTPKSLPLKQDKKELVSKKPVSATKKVAKSKLANARVSQLPKKNAKQQKNATKQKAKK